MPYRYFRTACMFAFALTACTPKVRESGPARGYDRNVITREEIAQRSYDNMHSVVSSLRSDWLRSPMSVTGVASRSATAPPTIYLDGRRIGDLETLKSFSAESIERARYFIATEAQGRFMTTAATPVIELISRGRSP